MRHLQRLLAAPLLAIDRFTPRDLRLAREILRAAAAEAPALAGRLAQLGAGTMANDGRFADTFLHPREARLGIRQWLEAISGAGLEVAGLLDRYAELDDLVNPLSSMPTIEALAQRAADGRYEHNLELFVRKPVVPDQGSMACRSMPRSAAISTWIYRLKPPPSLWFSYDETRHIAWSQRLALWQAHLDWILCGKRGRSAVLLRQLPNMAVKRLLRIGAILPGQVADVHLYQALAAPLAADMEAPLLPASVDLRGGRCEALIASALLARGRFKPRLLRQAMARLNAAQV
jgi:hypothetical protein